MAGLILSEVHLDKNVSTGSNCEIVSCDELGVNEVYLSTFKVMCPMQLRSELAQRMKERVHDDEETGTPNTAMSVSYDEEGDMVLPRKHPVKAQLVGEHLLLPIYHSMASALKAVGLQVWTGALAMIDHALEHPSHFHDKTVLELGCGVGLAGFVIGMLANRTIITDMGSSLLRLCTKNFDINSKVLQNPAEFHIAELDWTKGEGHIRDKKFPQPNIIIACDVIYDNDVTDAFFATLNRLLTRPVYTSASHAPIEVVISTEKRLNFTLADLDVTCKEYDHFRKCLDDLTTNLPFLAEKIDLEDVRQHCEYKRTPQIEIWRLVQKVK